MKLLIASDHAGVDLKAHLMKAGNELAVEFKDLGPASKESVDYPDYAQKLAQELIKEGEENTLGVLICGSGVGISIAANRFPEIRAVLAESETVAKLGREHNHANVLCLGARIVSEEKALSILKSFLAAKPESGERHLQRIKKLGIKS